jgi:hypothetical protein
MKVSDFLNNENIFKKIKEYLEKNELIKLYHLNKEVRRIMTRIDLSKGKEQKNIYFNSDKEINFKYITKNIFSNKNDELEKKIKFGCLDCDRCPSENCECFLRMYSYFPYNENGDLIINNDIIEYPIFECIPDICLCKNCNNKKTQNGITLDFEIFETQSKGFGVRCNQVIEKGTFICEYVGEYISYDTAVERNKLNNMNYIIFIIENAKNVNKIFIDSMFFGNLSRFFNHCCDPNLIIKLIRVDNVFPRICFFSNKKINVKEELCFDYGSSFGISNDKKCFCNSLNCLGYLPYFN